ncbi:MAG: hypothetical protein A2075_10250 [Geobacteraceae bacterium GWC2_58_44]|nr:MAG: hypothetical protein A2075_10250 [Geobacteraceae bacterium GWC2_58_44]HBG06686.1 hypothetical protein [Geobacter sp.]
MVPDYLLLNFSDLSTAEFIFKLINVADKLEVHPVFTAYPEHVAGPDRLRQIAEQMKKLEDAAANRDLVKVAEKKAFRAESEQTAAITGLHLTMVAVYKKDLSLLNTTGFDVKQHRTYSKSQTSEPPPPSKLTVKNGPVSGSVIVTVNRAERAATVELQIADRDPSDESGWSTVDTFFKCHMEVRNLESVKRYYFRARYKTTGGTGKWSLPVSFVVV